jgi:hypothetical protein
VGKLNDWLAEWDKRNKVTFDQQVEDGWEAGGQLSVRRYIDRHPIRYALATGLLFFTFTWGFLHFPLWVGVASGVGMVIALWTGWRPEGWLRHLQDTGTTKRPRPDKPRGSDQAP